jgi:hypothetical protein
LGMWKYAGRLRLSRYLITLDQLLRFGTLIAWWMGTMILDVCCFHPLQPCTVPPRLPSGHSMFSRSNFQHSDPRMKLSICEAKIMKSFGEFFFQKFKKVGFFKNSNFKNILNRKFTKIGL